MKTENWIKFSQLRESIHKQFQYSEDYIKGVFHTDRNAFYGATDALLDTIEMLRIAKSLHIKGNETERKLIAYGILNAVYVQQDSVKILFDLILKENLNINSRIRTLRNRLSGHPTYAKHSGETSSIPARMPPGRLEFQIYGLPTNDPDKFFQMDIDEFINENYSNLMPTMQRIESSIKNYLK
ncbi:hypothetical protein [Asticcacaulis sp.]|uniref:hypothetical protein n=1 Tax=Asticcacaulis sp. TaxID=1872648 RepID=UPI0026168557|nr:hypothetical protein [Asticcacaulis sp.]